MRLDHATWPEIEAYLEHSRGIILPTGSTEQHGPIGLIGTNSICAKLIAEAAADRAKAYVAPVLAYTPAPFNAAFPGTISISADLFKRLAADILAGLVAQGFDRVYVLNGHGANFDPLAQAAAELGPENVLIRSWWEFEAVNVLRRSLYGDWEGMHATPSEIAITQSAIREVRSAAAETPPEPLSRDYIAAHAGDKHGPPDAHRAAFPDGRVGSHSALARPAHGARLTEAATTAVTEDFQAFCATK